MTFLTFGGVKMVNSRGCEQVTHMCLNFRQNMISSSSSQCVGRLLLLVCMNPEALLIASISLYCGIPYHTNYPVWPLRGLAEMPVVWGKENCDCIIQ